MKGKKSTIQGLDHRLSAILYVWTMTLSSDLMGPHSPNIHLIEHKKTGGSLSVKFLFSQVGQVFL